MDVKKKQTTADKRSITFLIDADIAKRLEEESKEKDLSVSRILRQVIREYLNKNKKLKTA
jgi:predicted transcriptional regulator